MTCFNIFSYVNYREGVAHYVTTDKDVYSNEGLKLIDRFEKPTETEYFHWIDFFVVRYFNYIEEISTLLKGIL